MSDDTTFYTMTMAKVYVQQGQHKKAEQIYRYLLRKSPDRMDIRRELDQIEMNLSPKRPKGRLKKREVVIALFGEWLNLVKTYNFKKKLKKIRTDQKTAIF